MAGLQSRMDEFKKQFETGAPPYKATHEVIETIHRSIILVSSLTAHAVPGSPGQPGAPFLPAYAATKGAVEALARHLAAILGPRGIRVNAVAPGVIDTDMSNFTKTEAGRNLALKMQALKRIGKPEDVADVIAFSQPSERPQSRFDSPR